MATRKGRDKVTPDAQFVKPDQAVKRSSTTVTETIRRPTKKKRSVGSAGVSAQPRGGVAP